MKMKTTYYFRREALLNFLENYRVSSGLSQVRMGAKIEYSYTTLLRTLRLKNTLMPEIFKTHKKGVLNLPGIESVMCSEAEEKEYIRAYGEVISETRRKAKRKVRGFSRLAGEAGKISPGRNMLDPKRGDQAYHSTFNTFYVYNLELKPLVSVAVLESETRKRNEFLAKFPDSLQKQETYPAAKRHIDALERQYLKFVGRNPATLSETEDPWIEY